MSCLVARLTALIDRIKVAATARCSPMVVEFNILGGRPSVSCSLVCDVGGEKFLNVSPEEVVWLTDGEVVSYTVKSNTSWSVEY